MPKRISKPKLNAVPNVGGPVVVAMVPAKPVTSSMISQVMAEMGRRGGKIGGKRRLVTLSGRRRRQIAQQAAQARWSKAGRKKSM